MEELIEQFYPNYAWKEGFREIPTYTDDVHFWIEYRYEYDEYPKRLRLKENLYVLEKRSPLVFYPSILLTLLALIPLQMCRGGLLQIMGLWELSE